MLNVAEFYDFFTKNIIMLKKYNSIYYKLLLIARNLDVKTMIITKFETLLLFFILYNKLLFMY